MQIVTPHVFLQSIGYGALPVKIKGTWSLVPLDDHPKSAAVNGLSPSFSYIEKRANLILTSVKVPGIAIGLIRNKQLVYARGFGVTNILTRQPMSEYTMISVGSVAKLFTGVVITQLVEAGRISLEDTFLQHVPYFKMADPRYKAIKIRHLLAHTSGLPVLPSENCAGKVSIPSFDDTTAERLVRSLNNGRMLTQDPGGPTAEYHYTDTNYGILAELVHQVTGEYFEDYIRHHIFTPLSMHKTTCYFKEVNQKDLITAHVSDVAGNTVIAERFPYSREYAASGCLFTNITEMSRFVIALMNGGMYNKHILSPKSKAQLWTPLFENANGYTGVAYCSGAYMAHYSESGIELARLVIANGADLGYRFHMTLFPDQQVAVIICGNLCNYYSEEPDYIWNFGDSLAIQMLRGDL